MKITIYQSGSIGNLYTVDDGYTKIMIECGLSYKKILENLSYDVSMYGGCLVSHEHRDHARGIREIATSGIEVYLTAGTLKALKIDPFSGNYNIVKYGKEYDIGSFVIMPFETQHDAGEPAGYVLYSHETQEKLLFATDTNYLKSIFLGLKYIMIECNYDDNMLEQNVKTGYLNGTLSTRIRNNHFSLKDVKEYLGAMNLSKVKAIYLLHLSRNNADPDRFVEEIEKLTGIPTYTKEWD